LNDSCYTAYNASAQISALNGNFAYEIVIRIDKPWDELINNLAKFSIN